MDLDSFMRTEADSVDVKEYPFKNRNKGYLTVPCADHLFTFTIQKAAIGGDPRD